MDKAVGGNSYLQIVVDGLREPRELWLMRPDRVRVIPSATDYIGGYRYTIGTQGFHIPAGE